MLVTSGGSSLSARLRISASLLEFTTLVARFFSSAGNCSCCCCDDQDNPSHSRCKKKPQSRKCKRESGDDTCDYHLLMERVLDPKAANGERDNWRDSRMLCSSNPVSAAWSRDDIMSLAARTRQPVLVSVADDEEVIGSFRHNRP